MANKQNKVTKKMSGFFGEFKEFAMRGNVIDLAVGVIIGGAFQKIVSSVVNDMIMPFIGLLTGGLSFESQFLVLKVPEGVTDAQVAAANTVEAAKALGITTWNYGMFVTAIIDFLIMAFVIFLLVKGINRLSTLGKKPVEEPVALPTVKVCPFCKSEIAIEATRCPHCTSQLEE